MHKVYKKLILMGKIEKNILMFLSVRVMTLRLFRLMIIILNF